jgi:hypothetical protein
VRGKFFVLHRTFPNTNNNGDAGLDANSSAGSDGDTVAIDDNLIDASGGYAELIYHFIDKGLWEAPKMTPSPLASRSL